MRSALTETTMSAPHQQSERNDTLVYEKSSEEEKRLFVSLTPAVLHQFGMRKHISQHTIMTSRFIVVDDVLRREQGNRYTSIMKKYSLKTRAMSELWCWMYALHARPAFVGAS